MEKATNNKIALLIDGDNAQSKYIESMLSEAGKTGKVTIRRIYGNWTNPRLNSWKKQINKFAIRPIQKFDFAKGKNSTDTAMIIDAMDILHSKAITGFCIASSDSDYTGLAQRIREEGIFVMGIGEASRTTEAFVNACDIFVFTENLEEESEEEKGVELQNQGDKNIKTNEALNSGTINDTENISDQQINMPLNKITRHPLELKLLIQAFDMVVDDNGLAYMGEIGLALRKLDPSFDSRTYGFRSLTSLFKALPELFDFTYKDNGSSLFVKLKSKNYD